MTGTFEQLVGAAGDVRELEYISALHQTDTNQVRKDASIRGMLFKKVHYNRHLRW